MDDMRIGTPIKQKLYLTYAEVALICGAKELYCILCVREEPNAGC